MAPSFGQPLDSGISRKTVEDRSYASYTTEALDSLIVYGTDRYGPARSHLLVSNLDVTTRRNPPASELAAADEAWRADRRQRRAPGGANFLHNQAIYAAMGKASAVTGDNTYSAFTDSNFDWALANLVDDQGLLWWGYHRHYDVHTDTLESDGLYHEMHFVDVPLWQQMWDRNAAAVRTEIEAIWDRHVVNKSTGQINRHNATGGLSFLTSSGSFIDAFAFLSSKVTGDEQQLWLDRAKLLANYNWNHRDPSTDLVAHTPNEASRWDGFRSATTTPAVYAPALVRAWEWTGDAMFREQAEAYLKGWARHAYDANSGSFWASLQLDGTPVSGPWASSGYAQYEPRGLVDLWAPEFITAQYNPDAAKAYALAYAKFGDPEFLDTARNWATLVRKNLPATQSLDDTWYAPYSESWAPHGTYAEHYGHLIDFFRVLYEETGEEHYLFSARDVAKDAVSALYYEGLFRGHPNKPYFEAIDGVGVLLHSLVDLDAHSQDFNKFADFNADGQVDLTDYSAMLANWLQSVDPYAEGDVTGDGFVDLADFSRFKNEYYEGPHALAAPAAHVPEPGGVMLVGVASCVAVVARSRPLRHFCCGCTRIVRRAVAAAVAATALIGAGACLSQPLDSGITRAAVEDRSYTSYTTEALDNLITYGTDRYGTQQSNLLVSILDVRTGETAIPDFGDTNYRADFRFERRSPQGSNFLQNQPLLRTMYRAAEMTGNNAYASFANENISYSLTNLVDSDGMFWWGWHRYYDVVNDSYESFSGDNHEIHFVTTPEWEKMWGINPRATHLEIAQIWNRHVVDASTGQVNRHDHGHPGVSFIMTSASHIEALAFLSTQVPGPIPGETDPTIDTWLERAERLANYNYERRDPVTNLVAHIPHQDSFVREDEETAFTSLHLLSLGLLKAYEHTGHEVFLDQAMTYLTAYTDYGYDAEAETFWGTLNLDGTPDTSPRSGPLAAFPTGHIDFWQPNAIDREFPAEAAQSYADVFAVTGDETMKLTAERWAALIRRTAVEKETRDVSIYSDYSRDWAPLGTYAEHYGRVIDFFLTMYDETAEDHYLLSARDMAKDAVSSLYYEGFFRGHPNKPYYEALDGVPLLLESLLALDEYANDFTKFGDFDENDIVDLADYQLLLDHWLQPVAPYEDGDVTGDGWVDLRDFSRFKHEHFEGAAGGLPSSIGVPESNTLGVALVAGVGLLVAVRFASTRRPCSH